MVKMRVPAGSLGVSHAGETYVPAEGCVNVPLKAVSELLSHGCTVEPEPEAPPEGVGEVRDPKQGGKRK